MERLRRVLTIFPTGLPLVLFAATAFTAHAAVADFAVTAHTQSPPNSADADGLATISPENLALALKAPKSEQPLILNVGPKLLYQQAHISGAEYMGAGSSTEGIEALRTRLKSLPRASSIVLYCGCCPWNRCPNVRPAYKELHALGFTKVRLLFIANNFGADWVDKGYPTVKSQ